VRPVRDQRRQHGEDQQERAQQLRRHLLDEGERRHPLGVGEAAGRRMGWQLVVLET